MLYKNMVYGEKKIIHAVSFNGHYVNINGSEDLKRAEIFLTVLKIAFYFAGVTDIAASRPHLGGHIVNFFPEVLSISA